MIIPASFDRESRAVIWRYLGETFQVCIKSGMTPERSRKFAIEFVTEKLNQIVEAHHA
jgi:hypothetical protein